MSMHRRRYPLVLVFWIVVLLLTGCATRFSPGKIRDELARQSGSDPLTSFELNVGRLTTFLLKSALDVGPDDDLPLSGLDQLQLAVYESADGPGPAMNVTSIPVRGWEPVVRFHNRERSGMVLIRGSRDHVGDLVVIGAGDKMVVYARLRGTLNVKLPEAMGEALRQGGPEAVRDTLVELDSGGR
jgi:hypothetical protein